MRHGCKLFADTAHKMYHRALGRSEQTVISRFRDLFGMSPGVCSQTWTLLTAKFSIRCMPKHLLWACFFRTSYESETILSTLTVLDEKTQ